VPSPHLRFALGLCLAASAPSLAVETPVAWWEAVAPLPERSIELEPNGQIESGGWALGRLNDGGDLARTSFVYAEPSTPVRLYLIDTAIDHSSGWFLANSNLTLSAAVPIRGALDNPAISSFEHGTRMVSVIAGPETGAALGTPIEVINYDVYPGGESTTTTTTLLASALAEARLHHLSHPGTPGVVCIAIGSSSEAEDEILESKIDLAVAAGLTVIVSAGNQGGLASDYLPSAYGSKDGVICVGASSRDNGLLTGTNYGSAVDIYAPGEDVRSLDYPLPSPGAYDELSGTSPAAALATAAALTQLSRNPALAPAEVEGILKDSVYPTTVPLLQVVPPSDIDGDGVDDRLELFFGSDPSNVADRPTAPVLAEVPSGISFSFPVAEGLYDAGSPQQLTDGSSWRLMASEDLDQWLAVSGTVLAAPPADGKRTVTVVFETELPVCYFRIELTPAP